jgi:ketosteroid isomerase-like protein
MEEISENAKLVLETIAAYERGDDVALRSRIHSDAEIYSEPGMINSGTFTGFEGFKHWSRQWEEAWEEITYEPLEFIDVSDTLLVARVRAIGRGAGSGLEIDREFGYLYEVSEGLAKRFHLYENVDRALAAANRLAEES